MGPSIVAWRDERADRAGRLIGVAPRNLRPRIGRGFFRFGKERLVIRDAIVKLAAGESLDQTEASAAMETIMAGDAKPHVAELRGVLLKERSN